MLYKLKRDAVREGRAKAKKGDGRSPYRRDLARIIHSPCFRRLQGKTQLFPSDEGDFFRNRLTHSLEVAQIATGIALNLNHQHPKLKTSPIDVDLVHFASLAHDLGHPPFGHNGERVLDGLMKKFGGFEGNAQTLRILVRLEKKQTEKWPDTIVAGKDVRVGLNLTHRTIASILKYDSVIPKVRPKKSSVAKGYYWSEKEIVRKIRRSLAPGCPPGKFKTLECSIMDLADDIAYSTYDLEDAFKAEFISPLSMAGADNKQKEAIVTVINKKMREEYGAVIASRERMTVNNLDSIIATLFRELFELSEDLYKRIETENVSDDELSYALSAQAFARSDVLRDNGYIRSEFTSKLVYLALSKLEVAWNDVNPMLSKVRLDINHFKMVETLKRFAYESLITSNRLKMVDRRGREIIEKIFGALAESDGAKLLPDDVQQVYLASKDEAWRKRTICDFVASMTDRYCVEFYSRLTGINVPSIYKPF